MKRSRGFFKLAKAYEALFSTTGARRWHKKPSSLAVECLEARETPATYTWTPIAAGTFDWNSAANWGGAGFPNAADDVANLNNDIAAGTQTINLNVPITVGTLNIGDSVPATAGIFKIAANGGSLILDAGGPVALNKITGSPLDEINAPIQLNQPLEANTTVTLNVGGIVTGGENSLTKMGAGKLIFTANNALVTGPISIVEGTLGFATQSFSRTRTLDIADGAFAESSGTMNLIVDGNNTFNAVTGTGTVKLVGTANNATTNPDIYFGPNHNSNDFWGVGIEPKVDLGSVERFAHARSGNNGFGQYGPDTDAMFRGDIIGTGGLTIIGQQVNNNGDEVPYALYTAENSFTGPLTITRGSVYLNTGANLTGSPALTFNPTAGNRARLFLWGNSITIGNLNSSGAGTPGIANGVRASGNAGTDNAPVTLTVTQTVDGSYAGIIADFLTERSRGGSNPTGPFSLTKNGTATLALTGSASGYTGVTTINQGVLSVSTIGNGGANSSIGASDNSAANLVLAGGILQYSGANASSNRSFTLGAATGGIAVSNAAAALTFTGGATGTGNLAKTGPGALILNGVNDYTGTTTVTAGTLAGTGNAASATTVSGTLNPGSLTGAGIFNSGNLTFGSGGILAVNFSGAAGPLVAGTDYDQVNVTGTVTLSNTALSLVAASTVTAIGDTLTILSNDSSDPVVGTFAGLPQNGNVFVSGQLFKINYSGGDGNDVVLTHVLPTTLYVDDNFAAGPPIADADPIAPGNQAATFGTTAFSSINAAIAAAQVGTSIIINAGTYNEAVNIDKTIGLTLQQGPITIQSLAGSLPTSSINLSVDSGNQGIALTTGDAAATEFAGQILGSGSLIKVGSGSFKISGNNLFTGSTTVNDGTLTIGSSTALTTSPLTVNVGGKLQLGGNSLALTSFSGAGTVENASANAATLTFNVAADLSLSGLFQDGPGGGALGLTKTGAGVLTLASAANTYSGATTINGGGLTIGTLASGGSPSSIGQSTGAAANLVLQGGANLLYTGATASIDRGFTLGTGGATITIPTAGVTLTTSGTIAGGGALTKAGPGKLSFTNDSAFGTPTTSAGYGTITTGDITVLAGELQTGYLRLNLSRPGADRNLAIAANAVVTATGTVEIDPSADDYTAQVAGPGTLKLRHASASKTNPSLGCDIGPNGGDANPWGALITATVDIGTTGTQWIAGKTNRNDISRYAGDLRFDAPIVGSANLQFVGRNVNNDRAMHFVLNADNSGFTGGVSIANSDLNLTHEKALSAANSVTFNTTIDAATQNKAILFLWGHNVTIGSLNDTSEVGANNFIRNGALDSNNGGTNTTGGGGSIPLGLQEDSTLTINQTTAGTFKGIVADGPNDNAAGAAGTYRTLSIVKTGPAALTLAGANAYTGTTTVNAGVLGGVAFADVIVNSGGSLAPAGSGVGKLTSSNVSLNSGATLRIDINGPAAGTEYDQVQVTGATALNAGAALNVSLGYVPANGAQFVIVDNEVGASTGTFAGLAEGATFVAGGTTFRINYAAGADSLDVVLTAQSSVSTPTTTSLTANPQATTGGSLVTFTATIAPSPGNAGTVNFLDNGAPIPGGSNVAVAGGVAVFSTTTLAVGVHPVTAAYSGAPGFGASTSTPVNVTITSGAAAPTVQSFTINGSSTGFGGVQRSRVVDLTIVFDQAVQLDADAVTLALHPNVDFGGPQPGGVGALPTIIVTPSSDNKTFKVTFSGANTVVDPGADGFQSLKDGVYDYTIVASKVHPLGTPGVSMAANSTGTFHRLFGDSNAPTQTGNSFSAVVNTGDNLAFRNAFNKPVGGGYLPYFDVNGDGAINSGDNLQFRNRFNKALSWTV
jgi:fibronectin-binding autotransporter adhesin